MESGNSIELVTNQGNNLKKGKRKVAVDKVFKQKGTMPDNVRKLYGFKEKGEKNEKK